MRNTMDNTPRETERPGRGQARHSRQEPVSHLDRRLTRIAVGAGITVATVGLLMLTRTEAGAQMTGRLWGFLSFFAGVFALVSLTATVALGLLSADRVVLPAMGRVRTQLLHRATAMVGMAFLATHILMKISEGRAPAVAAVVPMPGTTVVLGLGTFASDVMILIFATGIARAGFADSGRPWVWRILHGSAYLAWPPAIMHGLGAGRSPASWVTWSYVLCLVAVGVALLIRVASTLRPRQAPTFAETAAERIVAAERPEDLRRPVEVVAARTGTDDLAAPASGGANTPTSIVGRVPRRERGIRIVPNDTGEIQIVPDDVAQIRVVPDDAARIRVAPDDVTENGTESLADVRRIGGIG
ncbi:hypothetical protein [Planobispora takensis]|uniref:DMSO/TMAO reductase YedYZ, heme-binding membrane subunit n=1 Tax=Planobispora takensis TaxID=1367882 RepID=A0A8J3T2I3_9ACTN|nr:hypothetical protein [Planobispora takensis]GII05129.1 hypothetical protein Pta02_71370 [Planobispora takensis]